MTKEIKTYSGHVVLVDDEDYEYLNQWTWSIDNKGYARRKRLKSESIKGMVRLHQEVIHADPPLQIDHIDRDKRNNTRINLRIATNQQNCQNRSPFIGKTSRYKGVSFHKRDKKFYSNIRIDSKLKFLGIFDCEFDAAKAYDVHAVKYFGEFAYTNFNSGGV